MTLASQLDLERARSAALREALKRHLSPECQATAEDGSERPGDAKKTIPAVLLRVWKDLHATAAEPALFPRILPQAGMEVEKGIGGLEA